MKSLNKHIGVDCCMQSVARSPLMHPSAIMSVEVNVKLVMVPFRIC